MFWYSPGSWRNKWKLGKVRKLWTAWGCSRPRRRKSMSWRTGQERVTAASHAITRRTFSSLLGLPRLPHSGALAVSNLPLPRFRNVPRMMNLWLCHSLCGNTALTPCFHAVVTSFCAQRWWGQVDGDRGPGQPASNSGSVGLVQGPGAELEAAGASQH